MLLLVLDAMGGNISEIDESDSASIGAEDGSGVESLSKNMVDCGGVMDGVDVDGIGVKMLVVVTGSGGST